jgi:hypothetical protein
MQELGQGVQPSFVQLVSNYPTRLAGGKKGQSILGNYALWTVRWNAMHGAL